MRQRGTTFVLDILATISAMALPVSGIIAVMWMIRIWNDRDE